MVYIILIKTFRRLVFMKIKQKILKLFLLNYLYFVVANLHLAYEFPINYHNSFVAGINFFCKL